MKNLDKPDKSLKNYEFSSNLSKSLRDESDGIVITNEEKPSIEENKEGSLI
jgi:hypothetical protein